MHRQDGRQEIDRRTLLAKGAAFAALFITGCARKESRGFAATSLRQLRARLERHIEPGFAPGMVGLVASGPEVETFVLGKMAFEGPDMRRDTFLAQPGEDWSYGKLATVLRESQTDNEKFVRTSMLRLQLQTRSCARGPPQ